MRKARLAEQVVGVLLVKGAPVDADEIFGVRDRSPISVRADSHEHPLAP